jgi:hypothetical protein
MPTIRRREIRPYRSRAHPGGLNPENPYLLAFLGGVYALTGVFIVWSAFVQTVDREPAGLGVRLACGIAGLGTIVFGAFFWRPLWSRHDRPALARVEAEGVGVEPWSADREWDSSGADSDLDHLLRKDLAWPLLVSVFLSPVTWALDQGALVRGLIAGVLFAVLWEKPLYFVARRWKFGPSRLRFGHCPFWLGDELTVYLQDLDRLKGARRVTATLRLIVEERERLGTGKRPEEVWVPFTRFEEVRTLRPEELPFGSGAPARLLRFARRAETGTELALRFELPANPRLGTHLVSNPPSYWELEVKADLPGIDYHARFLLPVYGRQA